MCKNVYKIILFLTIIVNICGCSYDFNRNEEIAGLRWIESDSFFVDYRIDGNKVTFRYSIHLINTSENAKKFSLSAKFKKSEINSWVIPEDNGYLTGYVEDDDSLYKTIKSKEEVDVIYTFEGDYLGGTINENLSFPEDFIILVMY